MSRVFFHCAGEGIFEQTTEMYNMISGKFKIKTWAGVCLVILTLSIGTLCSIAVPK
jgi:hypothetical protein